MLSSECGRPGGPWAAETRDSQPGKASGVREPSPFGETPPGEADRNLRLCLAGGGAGEEEEGAGEVGGI